jgi:hypothetical protein
VLEGSEKELGEQDPDTLASVYNLAYLLHKPKRYEEASGLYQRACDGYKQKLGTQHPTAIACLNHSSAIQQEAEQEGLGQSRTLINNGKRRSETMLQIPRSRDPSAGRGIGEYDKRGGIHSST